MGFIITGKPWDIDGMTGGPSFTIPKRWTPSVFLVHWGQSWTLEVFRYWKGRSLNLSVFLNKRLASGARLVRRVHFSRGSY